MNALIRTVTAISRFFAGIAAAMVATSLVLVCQMVVMEYALGVPAPWPSEIVSYLMMGVAFFGTPYVFATGGHVAIGLFTHRPGRIRGAIVVLVSLGFAMAFTVTGVALLAKAVSEGWKADDAAWMALWIPYLSFPLGAALLALQCLAELAAIVSGRESTAGDAADAAGFPD
ncbi:MAG TPA: TRAP transporter small permease subunit [Alphaproteobacteria bacterium]|nr:TRAP transporter small permease subunit [Alphaproteobacteria bacterium]